MELVYIKLISGFLFLVCLIISQYQQKDKEETKRDWKGFYVFLVAAFIISFIYFKDKVMFNFLMEKSAYAVLFFTIAWFITLIKPINNNIN